MGQVRFGIPLPLVLWLKEQSKSDVFVETGTNQGQSANLAAAHFKKVVTIEGYRPLYDKVSQAPERARNIEFLFGDSRGLLGSVAAELAGPAVFWLDAHWCGEETFGAFHECPVQEELRAINASQFDHVILIDDARLFLKPPPPPHRASDWPDMAQLCVDLSPADRPRCVAVTQDVIAAVPESMRGEFQEYLRSVPEAPADVPPSLPTRIKRRVRRIVSGDESAP